MNVEDLNVFLPQPVASGVSRIMLIGRGIRSGSRRMLRLRGIHMFAASVKLLTLLSFPMLEAISQPTWMPGRALDALLRQPRAVRRHPNVVNITGSTGSTGTAPDDAQLLGRIARRDKAAFSELYDRYAGVLYSTVVRILNSPDEAEDVLQDVFLQIWDKAPRYDPALGKPFNWAMTMTRNKAIDRLRALRRRYIFIGEITSEAEEQSPDVRSASGPDDVFNPDQAALVRSAVATLPLEQRQAIEMAFLGGMTQNEIAESLRQPLGTIKARIRRGMLKLRQSLRPLL